jgi:hypothetical protein
LKHQWETNVFEINNIHIEKVTTLEQKYSDEMETLRLEMERKIRELEEKLEYER